MTTALLGTASIIGALAVLAIIIYARWVLCIIGMCAVVIGTVATIGSMLQAGPDPAWPLYVILGGFAACLPALLCEI